MTGKKCQLINIERWISKMNFSSFLFIASNNYDIWRIKKQNSWIQFSMIMVMMMMNQFFIIQFQQKKIRASIDWIDWIIAWLFFGKNQRKTLKNWKIWSSRRFPRLKKWCNFYSHFNYCIIINEINTHTHTHTHGQCFFQNICVLCVWSVNGHFFSIMSIDL